MRRPRRLVYHRPALYPKQEAALFHNKRYGVVEATTKSGKTVGAIAWLTEQAMRGRAGDNFWWVAPVSAQASIAFERLKRMLPRGTYSINATQKTITLANHTKLWFKSGDHPDSLYGEDVFAAVIDEATRCKEEVWHAVRTTLTATKGLIRVIGNVKGRNNWAYRLARQAESHDPNMHYAKITALDAIEAKIFDAGELADAQRMLPSAVFRELYFAEASDDQGNPFRVDAIRRCVTAMSDGPPVVWGWDLAKSIDWTVGIALDETGTVCGFERRQGPWEETFDMMCRFTEMTPALIDSTGVGDPILHRLQRTTGGVFEGFHFSAPAKQQLMEGLVAAIHEQRVHFPDGPITSELETFEYEYTRTGVRYRAPEGLHDDCVCALALAVELFSRHFEGPELRLITGAKSDEHANSTGESWVERVARTQGAWFPGDY